LKVLKINSWILNRINKNIILNYQSNIKYVMIIVRLMILKRKEFYI